MSEEEIIKEINIIKETIIGILKIDTENYIEDIYNIDTKQFKAILGLLDLYNKEKEKNKELQNYMKQYLIPKSTIKLIYVSKEAIKEIIDKIDAEDYYCLNEAEEDLRKLVE